MTPYVCLQEDIIRILSQVNKENPDFVKKLLADARGGRLSSEFRLDILYLDSKGLILPEGDWTERACLEIFQQNIDDSGSTIVISNLLGSPLYGYGQTYGFDEYAHEKGNGQNFLRTDRLSQPKALKIGDVLATGCKVLSEPREGGNGDVLIHLTGGFSGHWTSVPSRIPIALLTGEDKVPEGYVD